MCWRVPQNIIIANGGERGRGDQSFIFTFSRHSTQRDNPPDHTGRSQRPGWPPHPLPPLPPHSLSQKPLWPGGLTRREATPEPANEKPAARCSPPIRVGLPEMVENKELCRHNGGCFYMGIGGGGGKKSKSFLRPGQVLVRPIQYLRLH